jgi:hypothetical protein
MSDHEIALKIYGPFRLYALGDRGLYRTRSGEGSGWQLVREFDPLNLARIRAAAERMPDERVGYALWLLDASVRTERDRHSESWGWELILEAEGAPIVRTFNQEPKLRTSKPRR